MANGEDGNGGSVGRGLVVVWGGAQGRLARGFWVGVEVGVIRAGMANRRRLIADNWPLMTADE